MWQRTDGLHLSGAKFSVRLFLLGCWAQAFLIKRPEGLTLRVHASLSPQLNSGARCYEELSWRLRPTFLSNISQRSLLASPDGGLYVHPFTACPTREVVSFDASHQPGQIIVSFGDKRLCLIHPRGEAISIRSLYRGKEPLGGGHEGFCQACKSWMDAKRSG